MYGDHMRRKLLLGSIAAAALGAAALLHRLIKPVPS
jgi:hypothetical protein